MRGVGCEVYRRQHSIHLVWSGPVYFGRVPRNNDSSQRTPKGWAALRDARRKGLHRRLRKPLTVKAPWGLNLKTAALLLVRKRKKKKEKQKKAVNFFLVSIVRMHSVRGPAHATHTHTHTHTHARTHARTHAHTHAHHKQLTGD